MRKFLSILQIMLLLGAVSVSARPVVDLAEVPSCGCCVECDESESTESSDCGCTIESGAVAAFQFVAPLKSPAADWDAAAAFVEQVAIEKPFFAHAVPVFTSASIVLNTGPPLYLSLDSWLL